jgi:hypothetical protein
MLGGVQLASTLPYLRMLDCGMSICVANPQINDKKLQSAGETDNLRKCQQQSPVKNPYQKLIIEHANLKKLSLWGCSALEVR